MGLSFRDVEELVAERGVEVDHVTVYRWCFASPACSPRPLGSAGMPLAIAGRSTDLREGRGQWRNVFRAVDQFGQVIDVFVSARRDAKAAHWFFERVISATKVTPVEVTTDRAPAYPAVLEELLPAAWHRTDRYANNRVECDHGRLKARLRAMRGLKEGPQRQGDHRGAWIHTEHSERTLRVGGGRASGPPGGCRVRRAGRGDLICIKVGSFSMPPAHRTQQCPSEDFPGIASWRTPQPVNTGRQSVRQLKTGVGAVKDEGPPP